MTIILSPQQVGTPQSPGAQRPNSDQDSDCVPIQVLLLLYVKMHMKFFLNKVSMICDFSRYGWTERVRREDFAFCMSTQITKLNHVAQYM